jgi:hypothetical protein
MALRHFTLQEATSLLPRLAEMIQTLRELRDAAVVKKAQIDQLWQRLEGGEPVLSAIGEEQGTFDAITRRLVSIAQEIEATGCVLRDLDMGLIDFPCRARGGTTVYLCWRQGEPAIAFWHGIDEGYAGRKTIARLPQDIT